MDQLNGILNLDKPAGITSAGALNRVKRLLPRGTKLGHAGTLDPFATGVLLLLVGKATKQCEALMGSAKTYEATIKLGATTATDDLESPEQAYGDSATTTARVPSRDDVARALQRFVGTIQQRPPLYSALKIDGKRACDRVRAGELVEVRARTVQIYGIELLRYDIPHIELRIDCGRGTYIRSIARDLGEALQVGGYLTKLRRTRIGEFTVETAVTIETLTFGGIERHLLAVHW